jgi:hypothetical protein
MSPVRLSIKLRSPLMVTTKPNGGASVGIESGFDAVFVRNRDGFSGDSTMKMISITSNTSIKGVTLIDGRA